MKRILISGGEGMIAMELRGLLHDMGEDDILIADIKNGNEYDLREFSNCMSLCQGIDEVYHLAGVKGSAWKTIKEPVDYMGNMLQFDTNMIIAAQKCGVKKFLYTSSIAVLYPEVDIYPAWAKSTAEKLIGAMRIQYPNGTKYCMVRPSSVYGRYDNFGDPNAMVLTALIHKGLTDPELEVWGDGSQSRDFVYAKDVAKGMILTMQKMPEEPMNLGSGYTTKIKDIADLIAGLCNKKVKYDKSKKVGAEHRPIDCTKSFRMGYRASTLISEGIQEVINHLKNKER